MRREFLVGERVRVMSGVTGCVISTHGNEYIVELDATGYPLLCHPEEMESLGGTSLSSKSSGLRPAMNRPNEDD